MIHSLDEQVDDDVEVVHQHPLRLRQALDAARQDPALRLAPQVDPVVDRLHLPVGAARADHEEVGVVDHPAQVEFDDRLRLLVIREAGNQGRKLVGGHRYSPCRAM